MVNLDIENILENLERNENNQENNVNLQNEQESEGIIEQEINNKEVNDEESDIITQENSAESEEIEEEQIEEEKSEEEDKQEKNEIEELEESIKKNETELSELEESISQKQAKRQKNVEQIQYFQNLYERDSENNIPETDQIQQARMNKITLFTEEIVQIDKEITEKNKKIIEIKRIIDEKSKMLGLEKQKEELNNVIERDIQNNVPDTDKIQIARRNRVKQIEEQIQNEKNKGNNSATITEESKNNKKDSVNVKVNHQQINRVINKLNSQSVEEKEENDLNKKDNVFKRIFNSIKYSKIVMFFANIVNRVKVLGKEDTEKLTPGQVVMNTEKILKDIEEKESKKAEFVPKQQIDHETAIRNSEKAGSSTEKEAEK